MAGQVSRPPGLGFSPARPVVQKEGKCGGLLSAQSLLLSPPSPVDGIATSLRGSERSGVWHTVEAQQTVVGIVTQDQDTLRGPCVETAGSGLWEGNSG